MRDDIYRRIGSGIREERLRLGWTQEELGARCGLHASYVGQIERGVKKMSLRTLERLAAGLGVPESRLLRETPPAAGTWEAKVAGLLAGRPAAEAELIYGTLRHLARGLACAAGPRRRRPRH